MRLLAFKVMLRGRHTPGFCCINEIKFILGIGLLVLCKRLGCITKSNPNGETIMNQATAMMESFGEQFRRPPIYFKFRSSLYTKYEESMDFLRK